MPLLVKTRSTTGSESHLFADNVVQVRNTDICFDKRDLIDLFGEGPLLDVVLDAHAVVGCRTALGNKHLLWTETTTRTVVPSAQRMWRMFTCPHKRSRFSIVVFRNAA